MRILIVNAAGAEEWRGGVERGVALAASLLLERGIDVTLLQAAPLTDPQVFELVTLRPGDLGALGRRIRNRVVDFTARSTRRLDAIVAASGGRRAHPQPAGRDDSGVGGRAQPRDSGHPFPARLLPALSADLVDEPAGRILQHALCELRARRLARWADAVSIVTGVSSSVLAAHAQLFPAARQEVLRNPMVAFEPEQMRPPSLAPLTVGYTAV